MIWVTLNEYGIFARLTGWLDALGLLYEMNPVLVKCLKTQGQECKNMENFFLVLCWL